MSADLISTRQDDVIDEFALFDDWMDKYEHLIELGKDVPAIDTARKTDDHLIKGCQSKVWLAADEQQDGTVVFTADSDAIITKGLVGLMVRVLSGAEAKAIAEAKAKREAQRRERQEQLDRSRSVAEELHDGKEVLVDSAE